MEENCHLDLRNLIKLNVNFIEFFGYFCPEYDALNKSDDVVKLPLSGWFPFNTTESPIFEIIFMYLVLGALINGLANISMDAFMSGIIMVISGQLKILNNAFLIIKQKCEMEPDKIKEVQNEVKDSLIQNVIHHKNIIQFANDMTDLFTTCIMGQFVVS
ncbi:7tm 6 domain containing protein, partial [Asbolus verrucosus]